MSEPPTQKRPRWSETVTRTRVAVQRFTRLDVPVPKTPHWYRWLREGHDLGERSAFELLRVLELGTDNQQYAAMLALRGFGYEVWGEHFYEDLFWSVKHPNGQRVIIVPVEKPCRECVR